MKNMHFFLLLCPVCKTESFCVLAMTSKYDDVKVKINGEKRTKFRKA